MQAFSEFRHMDSAFWAMIKYISETLGYTLRRQGVVRTYSINEIDSLLSQNGIVVDYEMIELAKQYFDMRADLLNNTVRHNLMNATEAQDLFERLYSIHHDNNFKCKLPMNKQKGPMKQVAYFTAIINIIAEDTLRHSAVYDGSLGFNDDPRGLVYVCLMTTITLLVPLPDVLMAHTPIFSTPELCGRLRSIIMPPLLAAG